MSYQAARGRYFGTGTTSGWVLSHGGLLPEEVIIPVVEWFGNEAAMIWPAVSFPEGALFDRDRWFLTVELRNSQGLVVPTGTLQAGIVGGGISTPVTFKSLQPSQKIEFEITVAGENIPEGEKLPVEITIRTHASNSAIESEHIVEYLVPRTKQLVERTVDQEAFESMF